VIEKKKNRRRRKKTTTPQHHPLFFFLLLGWVLFVDLVSVPVHEVFTSLFGL
jgi:hypothetical protein